MVVLKKCNFRYTKNALLKSRVIGFIFFQKFFESFKGILVYNLELKTGNVSVGNFGLLNCILSRLNYPAKVLTIPVLSSNAYGFSTLLRFFVGFEGDCEFNRSFCDNNLSALCFHYGSRFVGLEYGLRGLIIWRFLIVSLCERAIFIFNVCNSIQSNISRFFILNREKW